MITINVITNDLSWKKYISNPSRYLINRIKKLNLKNKELKKRKISFTLLLSGNKEIRHLNKKFRKKDKSTDVLSFPFYTKKELLKRFKKEKEVYLGDIIININKIKNKNILKNFKEQFDQLWIHGFVHLFGYDHKTQAEAKKMQEKEISILEKIKIRNPYIN